MLTPIPVVHDASWALDACLRLVQQICCWNLCPSKSKASVSCTFHHSCLYGELLSLQSCWILLGIAFPAIIALQCEKLHQLKFPFLYNSWEIELCQFLELVIKIMWNCNSCWNSVGQIHSDKKKNMSWQLCSSASLVTLFFNCQWVLYQWIELLFLCLAILFSLCFLCPCVSHIMYITSLFIQPFHRPQDCTYSKVTIQDIKGAI